MKILFLTQTGPLGPSSRYRVYQLLPHLTDIEYEVSPAVDDALYRRLHWQGKSHLSAIRAAWQQRQTDLARVGEFDAVFVQKGVLPGLYIGLERRFAEKKPLIFDLDDAVWLPRPGGLPLARLLHSKRAVQEVLRCATAVVAGNDYLAEYAAGFNRHVTVIPTAVDTSRYPQATETPQVGWIGSRTTLPYLKPLKPVFTKLGIRPRVIAAGEPRKLGFPVEFRAWRPDTELTELAQIGIGIAPLPDGPWERGKCGVKLLQYMACGMSVVASPVGVQPQIVRHGVSGFLAAELLEWETYLRELIADAALRRRLGETARAFVQQHYDVHLAAARLLKVLRA
ncbi:MAG: glycosyltransferase family 4 protein [Verrucomicrobiae bacterium]|nr:glycosyltransferase family 4 protein [Verrucomicrobiae bacterium]